VLLNFNMKLSGIYATIWHVLFGMMVTFPTAINFVGLCMQGDPLYVKVNKLTSIKTQLPYTYYSVPYCRPPTIVDSAENLGEVLRGDRIENSPYVVSFLT